MSNHIGETYGDLTIISLAEKKTPHGYLYYYWCQCKCGNIKRMRYDRIRQGAPCGMCEDFKASRVLEKIKERNG